MKGMMGKSLFSCGAVCTALLLIFGIVKTSSATTCGQPVIRQRVVGGQNSTEGKYPWMGCLLYGGSPVCGASLISKNWAITAAHCTKDRPAAQMKLMFGIFILEKPTSSRVVVDVEYVINNKKYVNSGNSGDMALIKMKISVTFSNYILPICLPEQGRVFPNGKICVLTGWGNIREDERLPSPMVLQEVGLPLINYTVCDAMFKKKFSDSYSDGLINSDMVCAGYPDGTKDGCQGDSGGPLACYADGHWLLVGIVSWGVGCATEGIGGVYTQVSNFTIWITSNTDLNETQPSETETKATTSQPPKAVVTTVTTPTTSQPPKPATTTKVCINQVTTAKPKKAAQSFNMTNDLSNSTVEFLQGDDPTDCGHRSSSPMSLLAVGLILTKI